MVPKTPEEFAAEMALVRQASLEAMNPEQRRIYDEAQARKSAKTKKVGSHNEFEESLKRALASAVGSFDGTTRHHGTPWINSKTLQSFAALFDGVRGVTVRASEHSQS